MSKTVKHKTADTPPSRRMPNRDVRPFFEKLAATIDEPVTELNYDSNFELLIAVILSAQATDVSVNIATKQLCPIANTPEAILALGEDGLKSYIKNIGLYNAKAKNVIKTCRDLIEKFDSTVPDNRKDLESLAGVGRKTANVVLNTAFGQPTMAVDTHIFRVACHWQNRTHRRKKAGRAYPRRLHRRRPSLSYLTRPLYLSGTYTQMRRLSCL